MINGIDLGGLKAAANVSTGLKEARRHQSGESLTDEDFPIKPDQSTQPTPHIPTPKHHPPTPTSTLKKLRQIDLSSLSIGFVLISIITAIIALIILIFLP